MKSKEGGKKSLFLQTSDGDSLKFPLVVGSQQIGERLKTTLQLWKCLIIVSNSRVMMHSREGRSNRSMSHTVDRKSLPVGPHPGGYVIRCVLIHCWEKVLM